MIMDRDSEMIIAENLEGCQTNVNESIQAIVKYYLSLHPTL
jgi:hypothetical protein